MHCDLRIIHNTLHTKQDASLWDMPIHPHQKEGPLAAHPGIDAVCWCKPRFKKVIIIVIDALRFDFVNPLTDDEYTQVTRPSKAVGYHLNKLPAVGTYVCSFLMCVSCLFFLYLNLCRGLLWGTCPSSCPFSSSTA